MSAFRRYLDGVHDKFGYLATWLPDEALRLGDVGELQGLRFYPRTTLSALGISFQSRCGQGKADWDHTSGRDVSIEVAGNAVSASTGVTPAGGGAVVRLASRGAFAFQALACRTEAIEDMAHVASEVIYAYRAGAFPKDWVVIDRLVSAKGLALIISDSKTARVELTGTTAVGVMHSLADAQLGVQVHKWEGEVTKYVTRAHLTPMFGASRLSEHFLTGTKLKAVRNEMSTEAVPPSLVPITHAERLATGDAL